MAPRAKPDIRIGISGWTYKPWRSVFYPKDLRQSRELEYASRMVNSIEINGTFYSLQRPSSYQAWYDATPADFIFSLKGGRYITHLKRLKDIETGLANYLASGVLALKEKLGPILWQVPPNLSFDAAVLDAFLSKLPRDTATAARVAEKHDDKLKGRVLTEIDINRPMRHAIEVRHPTFEHADFVKVLREHNVALVIADTAGRYPYVEDVTADFIYARLHGHEELYASGYTPEGLDAWAQRLQAWAAGKEPPDAKCCSDQKAKRCSGRDVYVYFDNDVKVRAPFDAMGLAERMGAMAQGEHQRGLNAKVSPKLTKRALAERVRSHWPAPINGPKGD